MAFTELSSEGELSSTIEQVLVSAPASSTRRLVRTININNLDTVDAIVTVSKKVNATGTSDTELFRLCKVTLEPDDVLILSDVYILDATNETIVAKINSSITTNNLEFNTTYADVTTD